jgi:hypothetical protein
MKKLILFISFFSIVCAHAQYYQFSKSTGTFANITGGTVLANDNWHYLSKLFKTPFTFRYFSSNIFDSIEVTNFSSIYFNNINNGYFDPYMVELQARGNAQSPISYVATGNAPGRILKIEFNNVGFANDPGLTDYMNFQVWIYEGSNIIEFRYGPNSVNASSYGGDTGPIIQVADPIAAGSNYIVLEGDPANPTLNTTSWATSVAMTGSPANGQIYRFTPSQFKTGITVGALTQVRFLNQNFNLPQNSKIESVSIMDMNGKIIMTDEDMAAINAINLPHSLYLVSFKTSVGIINRKLVL